MTPRLRTAIGIVVLVFLCGAWIGAQEVRRGMS